MEMIQINLLPKEFRKRSGGFSFGKTGYYAAAGMAGLVLMVAVVTFYQISQLAELDQKMEIARNRSLQLQKDIAVVDALIDVKGKIMQRMEAVDKLDRHRTVWVRVLEEVYQVVPEFTWLGSFEEIPPDAAKATTAAPAQKPDTSQTKPVVATAGELPPIKPVRIQGFAFTLNALANQMIKMMRSPYFSDVEMASVEEVKFQEQKAYAYKLTATLHYLSEDELKELTEQSSGPDLLSSM
jgi:Tfp pilus assembly protein PilN